MKKILFVIPTLRMGGAEKALVSLLKSLDQSLVEVDLFLFESGGVLQKEVPEWVNIIEADDLTKAMTLEARFYLKQLAKKGHIIAALSRLWTSLANKVGYKQFSWDILKMFIPNLDKSYDVAIGYLEGTTDFFVIDKVKADRKIGWIHTDLTKKRISQEEVKYYNCFDYLVTISEKCKNAANETIPGIDNKISVLENLVLPDEVYRKAEEQVDLNWKECLQLVTVGRFEYDKGIDIAAQAAKILKDKGTEFEWHVLGTGSQEKMIKKYICDNNIEDVFILHGMVSNPYPYIKKADLIIQPSRNEGKSIVLDESKILGKAIVVTDYSSVGDQIKDNETGIIVKIDPQNIVDGIEKLINNTDLKEKIENNCLVERNHINIIIKQFYKIIGI